MQNAKDTFYEVLRGRVAANNPERTIVLRGVVRPGVLVEENELVTAVDLPDCFRLQWTAVTTATQGAMAMVAMTCAIEYETAGTAMNAGMDRGRCLAAMDGELLAAVGACPQHALKNNYAGLAFGNAVVTMNTSIWWGDVEFGAVTVKEDRLTRTAAIEVFAYEEAGEM